ncbi:hypothetical protein ACX8XN_06015 [Calditrichota bacterium GD2]
MKNKINVLLVVTIFILLSNIIITSSLSNEPPQDNKGMWYTYTVICDNGAWGTEERCQASSLVKECDIGDVNTDCPPPAYQ